jgi:hypothetical protein
VATNCCVVPFAIDGFVGVTPMDTSVAGVTVNVVEPLTGPSVALMLLVPVAAPLAKPSLPLAFEIVAVAVVAEAHVTVVVRSCVVASVYVPVATNCCVVPLAIDGFVGVTAIETSVAGVTVSVVEPTTVSSVALMVVLPVVAPLARPCEPAAFEIVAVVVLVEAHRTLSLMSCVVASVYVPVATNCWVVPFAIDGIAGVTPMETNWAAVTVSVVLPVTPFKVALMVVTPMATDVAKPSLPLAFEMVAAPGLVDAQVTAVVRVCVVLSV